MDNLQNSDYQCNSKYILTYPGKGEIAMHSQPTANAMQNGETANVRYERAPKNGTFMYDSLIIQISSAEL